jgi:glycosyltransferase involved in cell wall biosynthesis
MRLLGPSYLQDFEVNSIKNDDLISEKQISKFHLFIIDRDAPRNYHRFKEILKFAHKCEIPIVYDIDDYLLELPENHPDRKSFIYSSSLLPMFEALLLADYVTVSTKKLKETLSTFNPNIYILPNFLDDSLWPIHLPIQRKTTKPITIGYMGSESHKPDIEWITPVLEKINQTHLGEINFHFYGIKPPEQFLSLPNVNHSSIKTYNYKEFIKDFNLLDVDIFIAPLIDNSFNQCKSPIKFFEYSTMGVPGVFSFVEPYKNIVNDGENGLLAKSLDDWFQKLETLIQDPNLCYKLAKNAQKAVQSNWLMSENAQLWTETYNNFIHLGTQTSIDRSLPEIIGSISIQLQEYHQHQNRIVIEKESISSSLEEKEKTILTQIHQLSEQRNIIQSLTEKLNEEKKSHQVLQDQLIERDKSIHLINQTIIENEKSNQSLSKELSKHKVLIQSLENKLDDKESELSTFTSQLKVKVNAVENLAAQINDQNNIIVSLKSRLSELEKEILFYSLSKSWRMTRPLRKIMSLFKGKQDV